MTTQEVKRKLAAILSADVEGYSRLMQKDEVGTIQTLNAYKEVMANLRLCIATRGYEISTAILSSWKGDNTCIVALSKATT